MEPNQLGRLRDILDSARLILPSRIRTLASP